MGEVWKAVDETLGKFWALSVGKLLIDLYVVDGLR